MDPEMDWKGCGLDRHPTGTDLKLLIRPIAAYVAANDDPRAVVAEFVIELINEAVAIEVAAQRYLDRHRGASAGRVAESVVIK
jgi:hypothetical protein